MFSILFLKTRDTVYIFLNCVFASSNFINLSSNHRNIIFIYKRSFTEILDVNNLRQKRFQSD